MKGADNTRFANVVLPHLDDAYALARWVMGNRADAEDVVQDACLRALRGISGYSGANGRAAAEVHKRLRHHQQSFFSAQAGFDRLRLKCRSGSTHAMPPWVSRCACWIRWVVKVPS